MSRVKRGIRCPRTKQWIKRQWLHGREWLECHYCGKRITDSEITLDHVKPVARGGSNYVSNLVPCCERCNRKKGSASYAEFIRSPFMQAVMRGAA